MKSPTQIKPPENWQDFETLCKKLWGEIWNCSDTIKKNGRSGQVQNGVDVYGAPNNGVEYYGIQCKGKDNYTNSQLTKTEIDTEIAKAQSFKPQLKRFYFATTAVKDAKIEEYIRLKNVESQTNGGFSIDIYSWEDIVDLLKENRNAYNWYINDCQYVDNSDVDIVFASNNTYEFAITPQYLYTSNHYKAMQRQVEALHKKVGLHNLSLINDSFLPSSCGEITYNLAWCEVKLKITNTGSTVIDDYVVCLTIGNKDTTKLDDDDAAKSMTGIGSLKFRRDDEVFVNDEDNTIEYKPKRNKLVQGQSQSFSFWIYSRAEEVKFGWTLRAANYSKSGELNIVVLPQYDKKHEADYDVNDIDLSDMYDIEPKIVKER